MNGKDIFLGLKYIGDDLVEKAEYGSFPAESESRPLKHRLLRRPFLAAAMIAIMLLLVGCAVVYMLSMKELKLGEQTATRDIFEYDPNTGEALSYVGQETYTQQVLTLAGLNGTPASQAAREWYAFCEAYDPNQEIRKSVWGREPEFPEEYRGYGLYTQEMKDKLDEILNKYDLKLRGRKMEFKTSKLLLRALGLDSIAHPGSDGQILVSHTAYHENGTLDVYFDITVPRERDASCDKANCYLYYRPKDCFIPDTVVLTDVQWEEWNYTTASGEDVLIIRSEDAASAWIFCDMSNYTASLRVDIIRQMAAEKGADAQNVTFELMSKTQLEKIADAVNFSMEPRLVNGWESLSDGAVPAGQVINGYRIDTVSAFTDGYGYRIVLKITAPEGVALTDPEDNTARIDPGDGVSGHCEEDGDGKLNTCHYILSDYADPYNRPEDGSLPYPEGYRIPVYWEDLYFSRYNFENYESINTLLTEGTWKFDVLLNDADTREIELLTEPITAKGCTGWKMDGTDVLEDLQITSIKLRSMSIELISENENADFLCFTGQFSYIVMKDGTSLEFTWHELGEPIDLDQVAYIQLADKTIIPMPGVDEETVSVISEMLQAQQAAAAVPAPGFEEGIELLTQPITMKSLGGYVTDATGEMIPLYEYLNITSIILHPEGLAIFGPAAFDSPANQATVIFTDGTQITLTGMGGSPYCEDPLSQLAAEETIDLSMVERILLPDGTEINMP